LPMPVGPRYPWHSEPDGVGAPGERSVLLRAIGNVVACHEGPLNGILYL